MKFSAPHPGGLSISVRFGSIGGSLHGPRHGISARRIRSTRSRNRDKIPTRNRDQDNSKKAADTEVRLARGAEDSRMHPGPHDSPTGAPVETPSGFVR